MAEELTNKVPATMAQVVEDEIRDYAKKDFPNWTYESRFYEYLNNFHDKLPSPGARDVGDRMALWQKDPEERAKRLEQMRAWRSRTPVESALEGGRGDETREEIVANFLKYGYSERYLQKTREEYLADLDTAIAESGVARAELEQYVLDLGKQKPDIEKIKQLFLPVFVKMREMGYSRADLAS